MNSCVSRPSPTASSKSWNASSSRESTVATRSAPHSSVAFSRTRDKTGLIIVSKTSERFPGRVRMADSEFAILSGWWLPSSMWGGASSEWARLSPRSMASGLFGDASEGEGCLLLSSSASGFLGIEASGEDDDDDDDDGGSELFSFLSSGVDVAQLRLSPPASIFSSCSCSDRSTIGETSTACDDAPASSSVGHGDVVWWGAWFVGGWGCSSNDVIPGGRPTTVKSHASFTSSGFDAFLLGCDAPRSRVASGSVSAAGGAFAASTCVTESIRSFRTAGLSKASATNGVWRRSAAVGRSSGSFWRQSPTKSLKFCEKSPSRAGGSFRGIKKSTRIGCSVW
mmetsp:Transcript_5317/g.6583  ORF Transcript_5317/g.6583 Transcript_5317/m.6583 type:complete len:339 (-) Transcript_5317:336-1352(-)